MNGYKLIDRLYFDNDLAFNKQVYPIPRLQLDLLVIDWQCDLPLNAQPLSIQIKLQTCLIDRFKQTRTQ